VYSILKEREEMGCRSFSIKKHCLEKNSLYFKDTYPLITDNKNILYNKLISLLSIHEKAGIWRKCLIIATIIIFFIKLYMKDISDQNIIVLHILIICILYFYHNFMNFHYYRIAKNISFDIIDKLKLK